ncbi:Lipase [Nesidiocoris tenuis]|uniref:Lipase n=1 Tax=Nesidiocoris tenuis TaxID=355587 RepID=A0ABN7AY75_9HEMI|nr:Lipase [Nesidiocoris tenuis]
MCFHFNWIVAPSINGIHRGTSLNNGLPVLQAEQHWLNNTGVINTSTSEFQAKLAHGLEEYASRLLSFETLNYDFIKGNMTFLLYTRENMLHPDKLVPHMQSTINASHYQPMKKTVVLVHGYDTNAESADSVQMIKNELLKNDDMNVIGADWGPIAELPPNASLPIGVAVASLQSPWVGRYIGEMISDLIDVGQSPDDVHMVGHSLGAHIAGFAGKYLNSINRSVHRITALDPSSIVFTDVRVGHRLAENDAKFTDCLFTAAKTLAVGDTPCHANFYPNGCAVGQPGCEVEQKYSLPGGCSHSRVVELFAESINTKPIDFPTKMCDRMPCVGNGAICWPTSRTIMGYWANPEEKGIFYTETNGKPPYLVKTG